MPIASDFDSRLFKNRCQEITISTGKGNLILSGPYGEYRSFREVFFDKSHLTFDYIIETEQGDWEIGIGSYNPLGNSLVRKQVLETSVSDIPVHLDIRQGQHRVSHIIAAHTINYLYSKFGPFL